MAPRGESSDNVSASAVEADGKQKFTQRDVYGHIGKFAKADNELALLYLVPTVIAYFACFLLPTWMFPLHSLVMMRTFVCFHDMAHMSFFSSSAANTWVGRIIGPLVLSPFTVWKDGHNYHHEHSNDLDWIQSSQTAPFTVAQYRSFSRWQRVLYRVACYPAMMVSVVGPFAMAVLHPLRTDVAVEWALHIAFWVGMHSVGLLFRAWATMAFAAMLGVFLFHLQHTFEGAKRAHAHDYFANGLHGSSFLHVPWFLRAFTARIEYHHIHHLNAKVPLYKLVMCHESAPDGMWAGVRHMTFAEGWSSLWLVLWDEERDALVTFAQAEEAERQGRAGKAKAQ